MISTFIVELIIVSLQATLFVICIWLLRFGFKRWLSPQWTYVLWILLLLKLTLPWLPESPLSLERWLPFLSYEHSVHWANDMISSNRFDSSYTDILDQARNLSTSTVASIEPGDRDKFIAFPNERGSTFWESFGWLNVLVVIWLIGFVIVLIRIVRDALKSLHIIRNAKPIDDEHFLTSMQTFLQKVGVRKKFAVKISAEVNSPSLAGIFKPVILLPTTFRTYTSDNETCYFAILHETLHWKRKDIFINLWFCALLCLHWFNPILWIAYKQFRHDQEIACDASVISKLSYKDRQHYALTLLNWAEHIQKHPVVHMGVQGFGGQTFIRRRIDMIMHYRKQRFIYRVYSIIIMLLVSALFLTNTVQSESNPLNEQLTDSIKRIIPNDKVWQIPAEGTITREFGSIQNSPGNVDEPYTGIAIINDEGTVVEAAADGVVTYAAYTPEDGFRVEIDHGQGWVTTYSHLKSIQVKEQQQVAKGDTIATMGSTGQSTGNHLKFEVRFFGEPIDPLSIIMFELQNDRDKIFPLHFPVSTPFEIITSFGVTENKGNENKVGLHLGLNVTSTDDAPIHAMAAGTVIDADYHPNYGNYVTIDHGLGWKSTYAHLAEITVSENDLISKGDMIGIMGSTGKTTGHHLHFELYRGNMPIDPLSLFTKTDDENKLRGLTWEELNGRSF